MAKTYAYVGQGVPISAAITFINFAMHLAHLDGGVDLPGEPQQLPDGHELGEFAGAAVLRLGGIVPALVSSAFLPRARDNVDGALFALVKLPTYPKRIFSMAITNNCAAGRETPRTSKQPILYT